MNGRNLNIEPLFISQEELKNRLTKPIISGERSFNTSQSTQPILTERPKPMVFPVGEGLTPEGKVQAEAKVKQLVETAPPKRTNFFADLLRDIPRAGASLELKREGRKELVPGESGGVLGEVEKFVFGEEPIKIPEKTGEELLAGFGVKPETARRFGGAVGYPLVALSALPGLPGKGKITGELLEQLAKTPVGKAVGKIAKTEVPRIFQGFQDLTTKFLNYAKGKTTLSRQEILDFAKRPELKKGEADLLLKKLEEFEPRAIPPEKGIIPQELQPLVQEARKFKSAEEITFEEVKKIYPNFGIQRLRQRIAELKGFKEFEIDLKKLADEFPEKTSEELAERARGSATQFGESLPALRKFGIKERSERLNNLGFDSEETITVYRGVPEGTKKVIRDGDFVVADFDQALAFTDSPKNVISKKVKAKDLISQVSDEFLSDIKKFGKKETLASTELIFSDSSNPIIKLTKSQLTDFYTQAVKGVKEISNRIPAQEFADSIRRAETDFVEGGWSKLQKENPDLFNTGILRKSQTPYKAKGVIPEDIHSAQVKWQNYGQDNEIPAKTIYKRIESGSFKGEYEDKFGNPVRDKNDSILQDVYDDATGEWIEPMISNKQLKDNLLESFSTPEGKKYLDEVIDALPKNSDGSITAYRIGAIGDGVQSYTLSEGMAKTFSNQGTDILPAGTPGLPRGGYKDFGVLPPNIVKIGPKGIRAWSPYDAEILVESKYVKTIKPQKR